MAGVVIRVYKGDRFGAGRGPWVVEMSSLSPRAGRRGQSWARQGFCGAGARCCRAQAGLRFNSVMLQGFTAGLKPGLRVTFRLDAGPHHTWCGAGSGRGPDFGDILT